MGRNTLETCGVSRVDSISTLARSNCLLEPFMEVDFSYTFRGVSKQKLSVSPNPKSELDAWEILGLLWGYRGISTPIKYSEDGTATRNFATP
jgi:hypothetical protein